MSITMQMRSLLGEATKKSGGDKVYTLFVDGQEKFGFHASDDKDADNKAKGWLLYQFGSYNRVKWEVKAQSPKYKDNIHDEWLRESVDAVDVEEYVRRVRDVSVRLESSKIVSPADAVVKALNGKQTVGGKLKHAESSDRYGGASDDPIHIAFDTPEGDTLDGDDYDYDGVVAAYNQYAKTLEQEARKLLTKAKVTGWNDIYVTNGYLVVSKD